MLEIIYTIIIIGVVLAFAKIRHDFGFSKYSDR
jgi:uncharacterized membrane protein YecN with MAPEG domain